MDDIRQLGEMLRHYAESEAHKKQLFESQSAVWATRIGEVFDQIQQWLEPVQAPNLLEVSRELYVASGPSVPVELDLQDRKTDDCDCRKTGGVRAGCNGRRWPDFIGGHGLDRSALRQHFTGVPAAVHQLAMAQDQWPERPGYLRV